MNPLMKGPNLDFKGSGCKSVRFGLGKNVNKICKADKETSDRFKTPLSKSYDF